MVFFEESILSMFVLIGLHICVNSKYGNEIFVFYQILEKCDKSDLSSAVHMSMKKVNTDLVVSLLI